MKPRRNLHRDPSGVRLGAPAPNPAEVKMALARPGKPIDWAKVARRAVAAGRGRSIRVGTGRCRVRAIDSERVLLADPQGRPILLKR